MIGQLEKTSASPDGVQHHELNLSAISQDAHHRLGYLVHGAAGSRAAVVVRCAHRQHNTAVARLEQRQRTPVQQYNVSNNDLQVGYRNNSCDVKLAKFWSTRRVAAPDKRITESENCCVIPLIGCFFVTYTSITELGSRTRANIYQQNRINTYTATNIGIFRQT